MIARLRARHLRMTLLLAVLIPVLLGLAIAARREFPREPIPAPLAAP